MIRVVDPTGIAPHRQPSIPNAPRLSELQGARLGFLLNEKGDQLVTNWEQLSLLLEEAIRRRVALSAVIRLAKPALSEPAPDRIMREFRRGSDGVVNGLGK